MPVICWGHSSCAPSSPPWSSPVEAKFIVGCWEAPGDGFSSVSLEGRGLPPTFRVDVLSLGDGGLSSVLSAGILTRTRLWAGSS